MATKLNFDQGRVNVSQRLATQGGQVVRTAQTMPVKTSTVVPARKEA